MRISDWSSDVCSSDLDALHRSWVVRTLFSDGKEATCQAANPQKDDHDYRLQSVLAGPEGEDLYLTLWDNRTNSRLWTGNVGLTGQEDNIGTALQIPLANLIGSFGAIATHQRRQYGDDLSPGYPCLSSEENTSELQSLMRTW